jgi:hypothetical protein
MSQAEQVGELFRAVEGRAMEYPVFYSWQNDQPKACNRTFIREALDAAVNNVVAEGQVEDSPRVDSGMEGVAGSPEVASVMFDKIDKLGVTGSSPVSPTS